jgi:hypothetical protein
MGIVEGQCRNEIEALGNRQDIASRVRNLVQNTVPIVVAVIRPEELRSVGAENGKGVSGLAQWARVAAALCSGEDCSGWWVARAVPV